MLRLLIWAIIYMYCCTIMYSHYITIVFLIYQVFLILKNIEEYMLDHSYLQQQLKKLSNHLICHHHGFYILAEELLHLRWNYRKSEVWIKSYWKWGDWLIWEILWQKITPGSYAINVRTLFKDGLFQVYPYYMLWQ